MTTFTALKIRLTTTVTARRVTAFVAPLACVPRVNRGYANTDIFCLVSQKISQLCEAPSMQASFRFAASHFGALANIRQIFNNDSGSGINALQNVLGQNMVAVPPEKSLLSREASQVLLRTFGAFGLQSTLQAKRAFLYFLPVTLAVKAVITGYSRTRDAQIHADGLPVALKLNVWQLHNHVQIPFAFLTNQVRRSRFATNRVRSVWWQFERHLLTALRGGKDGNVRFPIQLKSVAIETRRAKSRFWLRNIASFFLQSDGGLDGFGCFLTGLNVQIRDKRVAVFANAIGGVMQFVGVPFSQSPTRFADVIERNGELLHSFKQRQRLFGRWLQSYSYRSLHALNYTIQLRDFANPIQRSRLTTGHFSAPR